MSQTPEGKIALFLGTVRIEEPYLQERMGKLGWDVRRAIFQANPDLEITKRASEIQVRSVKTMSIPAEELEKAHFIALDPQDFEVAGKTLEKLIGLLSYCREGATVILLSSQEIRNLHAELKSQLTKLHIFQGERLTSLTSANEALDIMGLKEKVEGNSAE